MIKHFYERLFPWRVGEYAQAYAENPVEAFLAWRAKHSSSVDVFQGLTLSDLRVLGDYLQENGWSDSLIPLLQRTGESLENPPAGLTSQEVRGFLRAVIAGLQENESRGYRNFPEGWEYALPRGAGDYPDLKDLLPQMKLHGTLYGDDLSDFGRAAAHGDLEKMRTCNMPGGEHTISEELQYTAMNGHTETFFYAAQIVPPSCRRDCLEIAVKEGKLHLLPHIGRQIQNDPPYFLTSGVVEAIESDQAEAMKYLLPLREFANIDYAIDTAGAKQKIYMLRHLHQFAQENADHPAVKKAQPRIIPAMHKAMAHGWAWEKGGPSLEMLSELLDYLAAQKIRIKPEALWNMVRNVIDPQRLECILNHETLQSAAQTKQMRLAGCDRYLNSSPEWPNEMPVLEAYLKSHRPEPSLWQKVYAYVTLGASKGNLANLRQSAEAERKPPSGDKSSL